jgi:hypothetical protein
MLVCKFGCDALYEEGYLGVGQDGCAVASLRVKGVQSVASYLAHVDGRVCAAHDPASADYFAWHWQNTFRDAPK